MSSLEQNATSAARSAPSREPRERTLPPLRAVLRILATLLVVACAAALGWFGWRAYMATPWTRDGAVRAYVVSIAPQVAGEIVNLAVADNQFVHKGDLLMRIDPASYAIGVRRAEAAVDQAKVVAQNAEDEWRRRQGLNSLAVTLEEQQSYASKALSAAAQYQHALADLANARLDFRRTRVVSPVNGYVTNLLARAGDYADVGVARLSVIDADSFWVDAYFEETLLSGIHDGDGATVKLMGYPETLRGRVESVARGINVANATPAASGLATVNPIFAFVRLAQRVPVRVRLEAVPKDLRLVAGTTATVQIEPGHHAQAAAAAPAPTETAASPAAPAARPSGADGPAPDASAEAILVAPAASTAAGSTVGGSPAAVAASARPAGATAPRIEPRTPPRAGLGDPARDEAAEIASDEAFDRALNIDAMSGRPHGRAPELLRRRGRGGSRHYR